jgi:hypothetical protein
MLVLLSSFGILYPLMIIVFNQKMKKEIKEKATKMKESFKKRFSRSIGVAPN